MTILLDAERSRQGHTGDHLRYILGISLGLAVLAMGAILAVAF